MRPFFLLLWLSNFWKPYPILNATFVGVFLLVISFVTIVTGLRPGFTRAIYVYAKSRVTKEKACLSVFPWPNGKRKKERKREERQYFQARTTSILFSLCLSPPLTHTHPGFRCFAVYVLTLVVSLPISSANSLACAPPTSAATHTHRRAASAS